MDYTQAPILQAIWDSQSEVRATDLEKEITHLKGTKRSQIILKMFPIKIMLEVKQKMFRLHKKDVEAELHQ